MSRKKKILFVVNADWFFISHRMPIALKARKCGYEVHIATAVGDRLQELENYGFKVYTLSLLRGGFNLFNAVRAFFELITIFRNVEPDIVHLVTLKPVLLGGLAARWVQVPALVSAVSGLGYVFTDHGVAAIARRWFIMCIYSWAFGHKNQTVIFQNKDDYDALAATTGLLPAKVEIIRGSGVDLHEYRLTPELSGVPIVLFPARLLIHKGIFEFVKAAELLIDKGISARFVLAGMVDLDNPSSVTQMKLDSWVAEGVVEYWGHRTDMPQVIAISNLVVLPSYREGLPKVLLEAAAVGRAVVTTNVAGCRDAVEPNVTGLLVPPQDAESLALAIEHLLKNPNQRMEMGLAGRKLAENQFDVRAVVDKHMKIYTRLVD
jgi:glycosyltransferase involved in cell wall biosynthesis